MLPHGSPTTHRINPKVVTGLGSSGVSIPLRNSTDSMSTSLLDSIGTGKRPLPDTLIIVTKKLPLEIKREVVDANVTWTIEPAASGPIASSIYNLRKWKVDVSCVGTLPCYVPPSEQPSISERLKKDHNCIPVFPPEDDMEKWITFCKSFLWPLLNSQLVQDSQNFDEDSWNAYLRVNESFSRTISRFATGQDVIWVHDYHLIPLLLMLRKQGFVNNRIGYFWHTPFPTSEIFRILPVRDELLTFTSGADLVGFQTWHDMRHYMSACARILATDVGQNKVIINGREVVAGIHPTGADPSIILKTLEMEETKIGITQLKKAFMGMKIIAGRDSLDTIKGIPQKLHGYEDFLKRYPEWRGKVVLLQSCTTARESVDPNLEEQVNMLVAEINGRWAEADFVPIHFLNKDKVPYSDIVAILSAADACLLTPLRDGMNLTAQEYVLVQEHKHGPLILSEFAGSSQSLSGAVLVNPWDTRGIADAIHKVLTMDEKERLIKHKSSYEYCKKNTSSFWATSFLDDLMSIDKDNTSVPELNMRRIMISYKSVKKKRLLLLDYDGTLVPIASLPSLAVPSEKLLSIIENLCSDPKNIVYVVSGRKSDFMEAHFGKLPVGLVCEHGVLFKPYGEGERTMQDLTSTMDVNDSWKEVVIPIFQDYSEVTPHTWVEEKTHSIAWHYRNADPDFALFQTKELIVHLQNVASGLPVEIMLGRKVLEVRAQSFNKGTAVRHILNELECEEPEFILAIGDDRTDEDMFNAIASYEHCTEELFTVSVARKETTAMYTLPSQSSVERLLVRFNSLSK